MNNCIPITEWGTKEEQDLILHYFPHMDADISKSDPSVYPYMLEQAKALEINGQNINASYGFYAAKTFSRKTIEETLKSR